jgi:hypothetical protein
VKRKVICCPGLFGCKVDCSHEGHCKILSRCQPSRIHWSTSCQSLGLCLLHLKNDVVVTE